MLISGGVSSLGSPASLGVIAGLVIGKPLGIVVMAWIAVQAGIATKPDSFSWSQIMGAGCLAGVGFTMSIFIASAAFVGEELESVKLAILVASALAAVIGMSALSLVNQPNSSEAKGE